MTTGCRFAWFVAACVAACGVALADDKADDRTGTVTGVVTAKGGNWIEVKADGEDKARKYYTGSDPVALRAVKETEVDSRVRMEWRFREVFRVVKIELLKAPAASADDKKSDPKPDDKKDPKERKGTVTGVVTAKGDTWIEVKADGEDKARRYVPHWRGGAPDKGGGLDKDMLKQIKEVPLNSRVRLEWVFEERPRVEKIEVLRKGEPKDDKKPEKK